MDFVFSPLARRLLTVVVSLSLLAGLAYQGARLFWHLLTPTVALSVPAVTSSNVSMLPTWRLATTTTTPGVGKIKTSASLSNWQLKGIYLEDGNESVAIIQGAKGDSHVVEVNEHLSENVTVVDIQARLVVLDANGSKVELTLQDNTISDIHENTLGLAARPAAENTADDSAKIPDLQQLTAEDLLQLISLNPVDWQGQGAYTLVANNARGQKLLASLGLLSGDVLLAINETPIQQLNPLEIPQLLKKMQKISAKIYRNGTIATVNIK